MIPETEQPRALQAVYRNSLSAFTQKSFGIVSPGDKYAHNWHVDYIAQLLEACYRGEIKRLVINIPPRYMKSICGSVAFAAWVLGRDPSKKIISVSYSADLALKHSLDCRKLMESPTYRQLFPATRLSADRNTQLEYTTTMGGSRLATSVGGTLTGLGGDFIILDDPIKPDDAQSDLSRSAVNRWYDSTLYSRLNDPEKGCIIIIMQRLHEDDLVGHVLEQEGWTHVRIPAIAEEQEVINIKPLIGKPYTVTRNPGDVLHPQRQSAEALQKIKNNVMGSYLFAAQYQQSPAPFGGGIIKWHWFQFYDALPVEPPLRIVQSWDTASKAADIHDYSVGTVWYEYATGWYLIKVIRERLEFPDLKKRIKIEAEAERPHAILIEDKGSGIQLIQDLKRETRCPVIGINPQGDKVMRMLGQSPKIEAGRVFLPRKAPWLADFEDEITKFPKAKNDDQVDSLSQALEWMDSRRQARVEFL